MVPDMNGVFSIAIEALYEHEHDQVLAWLVGVIVQEGYIERLAQGQRDVVFLLPDRLVIVRPAPFDARAYQRDEVVRILFAADHVQFDVVDNDVQTNIKFWIDTTYTPAEHIQQTQQWLAVESSSGCGGVALGLVVLAAVVALGYYGFSTIDEKPTGGPLNARSTCSEFLRASSDERLAVMTRLYVEAGKPQLAENPPLLEESIRQCEQNPTATLDTLVAGR